MGDICTKAGLRVPEAVYTISRGVRPEMWCELEGVYTTNHGAHNF